MVAADPGDGPIKDVAVVENHSGAQVAREVPPGLTLRVHYDDPGATFDGQPGDRLRTPSACGRP